MNIHYRNKHEPKKEMPFRFKKKQIFTNDLYIANNYYPNQNPNSQSMNQKQDKTTLAKNREKAWDNRFIYSKIPNYDSKKDKNVADPKKLQFDPSKIYYKLIRQKSSLNRKIIINKSPLSTSNKLSKTKTISMPKCNNQNYNYQYKTFIPINKTPNNKNKFNLRICPQNIEFSNNETNNQKENFDILTKLWNELCVLDPYRELYNVILSQLDEEEKNDFYQNEIIELNKLKTNVISV